MVLNRVTFHAAIVDRCRSFPLPGVPIVKLYRASRIAEKIDEYSSRTANVSTIITNRIMYREAPTGSHVREPPSAAYIIYARARLEELCLVD